MITCEQFMAELGDYLEGQSAVEVREQVCRNVGAVREPPHMECP